MKANVNPKYKLVVKWITALMVLGYMGMGGAVLLGLGNLANIPTVHKLPLGVILLCYGMFRAYRLITKIALKNKNETDEP